VTLPIKINSKESCREKLVEINVEEDRKTGISSIINIGMQILQESTGTSMVFILPSLN